MTHQAITDRGVQPDQGALVVNRDGTFYLLFPDVPADTQGNLADVLVTAIAIKLNDRAWVKGLLAELAATWPD